MIIEKTYKDEISWFEVDEADVIEYAENSGFYKKGTAIRTLKQIGRIETDFAIYRMRNLIAPYNFNTNNKYY